MDDLVVGPLHEGGIDRHDGDESLGGKPRGEGHAVLLSHPHIVETVGKFSGETVQPRPFGHRRRNRDDPLVLTGQRHDRLAEYGGIGGRSRRPDAGDRFPRFDVERGNAVKPGGVVLGVLVPFSLLRHNVDQDWPL